MTLIILQCVVNDNATTHANQRLFLLDFLIVRLHNNAVTLFIVLNRERVVILEEQQVMQAAC